MIVEEVDERAAVGGERRDDDRGGDRGDCESLVAATTVGFRGAAVGVGVPTAVVAADVG